MGVTQAPRSGLASRAVVPAGVLVARSFVRSLFGRPKWLEGNAAGLSWVRAFLQAKPHFPPRVRCTALPHRTTRVGGKRVAPGAGVRGRRPDSQAWGVEALPPPPPAGVGGLDTAFLWQPLPLVSLATALPPLALLPPGYILLVCIAGWGQGRWVAFGCGGQAQVFWPPPRVPRADRCQLRGCPRRGVGSGLGDTRWALKISPNGQKETLEMCTRGSFLAG